MKKMIYALLLSGVLASISYGMEPVHNDKPVSQNRVKGCCLAKRSGSNSTEDTAINRPLVLKEWQDYCAVHNLLFSLDLSCTTETENGEGLRTLKADTTFNTPTRSVKSEELERMKKMAYRMLREEATRGLLFSVLRQEPARVLQFIVEGAYVNVKDGIKWTPLHYAARDRHVEIAKILLAVPGIDTAMLNGQGDTVEKVVQSRKDGATEAHQVLCDQIFELLCLHAKKEYPYAIHNGKLIKIALPAQTAATAGAVEESSSEEKQPHVAFINTNM